MRLLNTRSATVLAGALLAAASASAATTSINYGSLGAAANGTNTDGVVLGVSGPLADPNDTAATYSGGSTTTVVNTVVPYTPALNPSASSPFTIEFWHKPTAYDDDDSPLFNRYAGTDVIGRAGWAFFQRRDRDDTTRPTRGFGWNFAMYNGVGSNIGIQLTGGDYALNTWNHVVVTWDGNAPTLYVNGVDTGAVPSATGAANYNVNTTDPLSIGAYANGGTAINGSIDEVAFYGTALSPAQIQAHYNAAANPTPGAYAALVQTDGAQLHLRNIQVPEPASAGLALLGLAAVLRRRR